MDRGDCESESFKSPFGSCGRIPNDPVKAQIDSAAHAGQGIDVAVGVHRDFERKSAGFHVPASVNLNRGKARRAIALKLCAAVRPAFGTLRD